MFDHFWGKLRNETVSLLDQTILVGAESGSLVQGALTTGKRTVAAIQQATESPLNVSQEIHNITQPIANLVKHSDQAAMAVTQGSSAGQMAFQVMGLGALGWMGWNLFAYMAPRKHYMLRGELERTAKRIRSNW